MNHSVAYRYINKNTRIHLIVKPAVSSRNYQYFTRFLPSVSTHTNMLWGWVGTEYMPDIQDSEIVTHSIEDVKNICDVLSLPLIVSIVEYCNIEDKSIVEEIYFWRTH